MTTPTTPDRILAFLREPNHRMGRTPRQIAAGLKLSRSTVERHLKQLMRDRLVEYDATGYAGYTAREE